MFKTIKAIRGQHLAMSVIPTTDHTYNVRDVNQALDNRRGLYTLYVRKNFYDTKDMSFTSFRAVKADGLEFPYNSRTSLREVLVDTTLAFRFKVEGVTTTTNRLPPPFDTMCQEGHNPEQCYDTMMNECLGTIGYIYWSSFVTDSSNLTIMDRNAKKQNQGYVDECKKKADICLSTKSCQTMKTDTKVNVHPIEGNDSKISALATDSDDFTINHEESLTILELLIYIVGIGGPALDLGLGMLTTCCGIGWRDILVPCGCVAEDPEDPEVTDPLNQGGFEGEHDQTPPPAPETKKEDENVELEDRTSGAQSTRASNLSVGETSSFQSNNTGYVDFNARLPFIDFCYFSTV